MIITKKMSSSREYSPVVLVSPTGSITQPRFPSLKCLYCDKYSRYNCEIEHKKKCFSGKEIENLLDFLFDPKITDPVLLEFVRRYNEYYASN